MKQLSTIKESTIKGEKAGRSVACMGLFSIVALAAMFMLATPALAKSGFSISFSVSDGFYNDSRMDHGYGRHTHRDRDYFLKSFYDFPPRRHLDRRHKHKAWRKHRHDNYGHLNKHKFNRRHRSGHNKNNHFRRW